MAFAPPQAAPGPGPGQPPLSPGQQSSLASALGQDSNANPKIKALRTDPQYRWQGDLNSIKKACAVTLENIDTRTDDEQVLITSIYHAVDGLLKKVEAEDVCLSLTAEVCATGAPDVAAMAQQKLNEKSRPPTVPGTPQPTGLAGMMGAPGPPSGGPAGPFAGGPAMGPPTPPAPGMPPGALGG